MLAHFSRLVIGAFLWSVATAIPMPYIPVAGEIVRIAPSDTTGPVIGPGGSREHFHVALGPDPTDPTGNRHVFAPITHANIAELGPSVPVSAVGLTGFTGNVLLNHVTADHRSVRASNRGMVSPAVRQNYYQAQVETAALRQAHLEAGHANTAAAQAHSNAEGAHLRAAQHPEQNKAASALHLNQATVHRDAAALHRTQAATENQRAADVAGPNPTAHQAALNSAHNAGGSHGRADASGGQAAAAGAHLDAAAAHRNAGQAHYAAARDHNNAAHAFRQTPYVHPIQAQATANNHAGIAVTHNDDAAAHGPHITSHLQAAARHYPNSPHAPHAGQSHANALQSHSQADASAKDAHGSRSSIRLPRPPPPPQRRPQQPRPPQPRRGHRY